MYWLYATLAVVLPPALLYCTTRVAHWAYHKERQRNRERIAK